MHLPERKPFRPVRMLTSLALIAGAAVSGWALYREITWSHEGGHGKALAHIERLVPSVRRKAARSFVWAMVGAGDQLYRRDSIQVGDEGIVVLRFEDNTKLEVGPQSLVVIDDEKAVNLNFLKGSFIIRKDSGDELIQVKNRGAKKEVQRIPVRLLAPASQTTYFVNPGESKPIGFQWKGEEGLSLELSRSPQFKGVSPLKLERDQTTLELKAGRYYWRLADGKGPVSETRFFTVEEVAPPKATFPVDRSVAQYGESAPTEFRWVSETPGFDKGAHELQVSTDPNFKTLVRTESINPQIGHLQIQGLKSGKYYWRIQSKFEGLEVQGAPHAFEVKLEKTAKVQLLGPRFGKTFDRPESIRFSWSTNLPPDAGAEYKIEIQDKSGKPVHSETLKGLLGVWSKPQPGLHRWRVVASVNGQKAGESDWNKFFVFQGEPLKLAVPENHKDVLFWDKPVNFVFSWEADPLVEKGKMHYLFEVSREAGFQKVLSALDVERNQLTSEQIDLEPGDYFWRVSVVTSGGDVLKASEARQFYFGHYPVLAAPSQASPAEGEEVNILTAPSVTLSWEPIEFAQEYELRLYQNDKLLEKRRTRNSQMTFKKLKEGRYFWTVQAIDRIDRPGREMALRELNLTYGNRLRAPEFIE